MPNPDATAAVAAPPARLRERDPDVFLRALLARRDELIDALTEIATYRSAVDEINRSLRALAGSAWEIERNRPRRIERLATFLPSNNVLYLYVVLAVIPSLYCARVVARPSTRVARTTLRVHELLSDGHPWIECSARSQRQFLRLCADAQAVIFTGRYENAVEIAEHLPPDCRMLMFGSGPNPFVVGPHADVERAVADLVSARLYNSGQDCLCPDVAFVHRDVRDAFLGRLERALDGIAIADRQDPGALVAPLVYADALDAATALLATHADRVVCGEGADGHGGIAPTALELPWADDFAAQELFAPIFCTMPYEDASQVARWLEGPAHEHGMYASVYGEPALAERVIGTSVVCQEATAFDVEHGNRPFGGYGLRAGNVRWRGSVASRPLLLSRELRTI